MVLRLSPFTGPRLLAEQDSEPFIRSPASHTLSVLSTIDTGPTAVFGIAADAGGAAEHAVGRTGDRKRPDHAGVA
jgi:hypothetical protein